MGALTNHPASFYCHDCRTTTVVDDSYEGDVFACSRCGARYLCDECGHTIDRVGYCERPQELGDCSQVRPLS